MVSSRLFAVLLLIPAWLLAGSSSPPAWLLTVSPSPSAWLLTVSASPSAWLWPLPPPHPVARRFEAPASAYAAGHRGIDLPARRGDAVFAPADGVVSFSGTVAGRPVLAISHEGDLISSVEPVLAGVAEGERVLAGQQVGLVASGGHCADACLHFGVRLHGHYVSPMLVLGGVPRAVLLPLRG